MYDFYHLTVDIDHNLLDIEARYTTGLITESINVVLSKLKSRLRIKIKNNAMKKV